MSAVAIFIPVYSVCVSKVVDVGSKSNAGVVYVVVPTNEAVSLTVLTTGNVDVSPFTNAVVLVPVAVKEFVSI